MNEINLEIKKWRDQIVRWRRRFHQFPELGLTCDKTAGIVAGHLQRLGLKVQPGMAQTGIVGLLQGEREGPVIGLRVDMDALPIKEKTGLPYASAVPGVMHACGHDGHVSMGLGVASVLSAFKNRLPGTVKFIFQPGEESPGGARLMIEEGILKDPPMDCLLGCHIYPSIPSGRIGVCMGTATAGDYEFEIHIKGSGGHGARPHECKDAIIAAADLIQSIQTIVTRRTDPLKPLLISLGEIHGGSGFNVVADHVTLKGIIRYIHAETRELALNELAKILKGIGIGHEVEAKMFCMEECPPMRLNQDLALHIENIIVQQVGREEVIPISEPSMGAEDFAYFTDYIPCGYIRFGCFDREKDYTFDLHHPSFNYDEEILIQGTKIMAFLICSLFDKI